jgi:hypothetical protein
MKRALTFALVLGLAGIVRAADKPFNASLTPDIAIQPTSATVSGLTLSIWGQNQQHSLAIGFVNGTSGDSSGLCIGLVNYGDKYTGVQWGIVNYEKGDFLGWQSAAVNYTDGMFTGFQSGWIDYAGNLNGFQLGLVNIADQAKAALQIGLVNIIQQNTMWFRELPDALAPGMVIANWRF